MMTATHDRRTNDRRWLWLLLFTALLLAASYLGRAVTAGNGRALLDGLLGPAEPPIPDVLSPAEQIAFWSARLKPDTQDYLTLTTLAGAYLARARETGDAADYGRAEEALRRALALNPRYEKAAALLGGVLIGQHAFAEALAQEQAVLATNPDAPQALATSGDAYLEMGDLAAAEAAYRHLLELAPDGPAYSRLSRLAWIQGRPEEAIDWMRRAADETVALDVGGEELAWYRFQLGELYYNRGDLRHARRWYGESEQALPGYYLASAGLGKVAAARGDYDGAIARYEALVARLPQPAFVAALGDYYALSGDAAAAQEQYDTVAFIHQLDESKQVLYNRQMAQFFANHNIELDTALAYAQGELAARQDIYAYDTLAWALYRAGRLDEAADAAQRALAHGTPDAALYYHAGMIAAARGQTATAIDHLRHALDLNPNFDLLQARQARATLAALQGE